MTSLPPSSVHPLDLETWRRWLGENHASATEVWMVSYKRTTGRPRLEDEIAVEEARCWGWIAQAVRGSPQNLRMDQWKSKETT